MTTKRSSRPTKKATRKTTSKTTSKTSATPKQKPGSQPALDVIDKGARFLKQAILRGEAETAEGRKVLKKHALSFVEEANKKLAYALDGTTSTVRKGLRKL